MTLSSRGPGQYAKFRPIEICDESVYDMANHWYTADEIAERFNTTTKTVLEKYGTAFREGKAAGKQLPRMMLRKVISDFEGDLNFANSDTATQTLLAAIKLQAQIHEGLGKQQPVIIQQVEKPSVSEIRFEPLKAPQ